MAISGPFFLAIIAFATGSGLLCAAFLMGAFTRPEADFSLREIPYAQAPESHILTRGPFAGATVDAGAEIRMVLRESAPEASDRFVAVDVAIAPDLALHADRGALRTIVEVLAGHAIGQAREQVLVSAARVGGRVRIAFTDDGGGSSRAEQLALLRLAAELAALQGGTLEIETWPRQGTTLSVWLPAPAETTQRPALRDQRAVPAPHGLEDETELAAEPSWEA